MLGYIAKELAVELSPKIESNEILKVNVTGFYQNAFIIRILWKEKKYINVEY